MPLTWPCHSEGISQSKWRPTTPASAPRNAICRPGRADSQQFLHPAGRDVDARPGPGVQSRAERSRPMEGVRRSFRVPGSSLARQRLAPLASCPSG